MKNLSSQVIWVILLAALVVTAFAKGIGVSKSSTQSFNQSGQYEMQEPFSSGPLIVYSSLVTSPHDS